MALSQDGSPTDRYRRAESASRALPQAEDAARAAWAERLRAEEELARCQQRLLAVSGGGPQTWGARLTGRLGEKRAAAVDAVHRAEGPARQAQRVHEHKAALVRELQATADQLPAARQALIDGFSGPELPQLEGLIEDVQKATEALTTVDRARLAALDVQSKLSGAMTWSTHDTWFGGGWLSSTMKHDHLHSVDDADAVLTSALTSLRAELQQIGAPTSYFSVQTNDMTATTDIWWDNIFSDLAMSKRINTASERIKRLLEGLAEVAQSLGERRTHAMKQIDQLLDQASATASE